MLLAASLIAAYAAAASANPINLHNGLLLVYNHSSDVIDVRILTLNGDIWEEDRNVPPGAIFHTSGCCYAAGTQYRVYILDRGRSPFGLENPNHYVRPKLCSRNGIPYGFAEIVVTHTSVNVVENPACYEGPV